MSSAFLREQNYSLDPLEIYLGQGSFQAGKVKRDKKVKDPQGILGPQGMEPLLSDPLVPFPYVHCRWKLSLFAVMLPPPLFVSLWLLGSTDRCEGQRSHGSDPERLRTRTRCGVFERRGQRQRFSHWRCRLLVPSHW